MLKKVNCTLELSKLHTFSRLFMFENVNHYNQLNFSFIQKKDFFV